MALTNSIVKRGVVGDLQYRVVDVTFDSSYVTGGESLAPADLDLRSIHLVLPSPASGRIFEYDYSNAKLLAKWPMPAHTHTENTAGAYAQNATTAASVNAAASEIANGTDLSAITVRVVVLGY